MWKLAASFFELAFRLKAVIDEDSWNGSVYWDGKEVIFGSLIFLDKEQVREVAKKQRLTHKETEEAIFSASVVLPCEMCIRDRIEARRKQYAYYRDKLLSFKEKVA